MDGPTAPGPARKASAFLWLLILLHILLGCALLSVGTVLRLRGGVPFLVLGGWFLAVGIGLAMMRAWAWWSAQIGYPLFLLGEGIVLLVSFALAKQGWNAEGMGPLGAVVMGLVFLGTLAAAVVSIATWFWLRRPDVRQRYFRSHPTVAIGASHSATSGLGAAISMLVIGALVIVIWGRASKLPRPAGPRGTVHSQARGRSAVASPIEEPCAERFLATSVPVRFTPDASLLVGSTVRGACVWNVATGNLTTTIKPERSASIQETAISPDGRLLAIFESQRDGTGQIGFWDLATGRRASAVSIPARGRRLFLAFGPSASTLVAQTDEGTIGVFDTATGAARSTWTGDGTAWIRPVAMSGSRKRIAFATDLHGPVRVAEVETGKTQSFDPTPAAFTPARSSGLPPGKELVRIESMLFSRRETTLFLGRFRSIARLNLETGLENSSLDLPSTSRQGLLTPVSTSADDSRLLTAMMGFLFPVFSLSAGQVVTLGVPAVSVGSEPAPLFVQGKLVSFGGWGRVVGVNGRVVSVSLLPRENMDLGRPGNRRGSTECWSRGVSPDGSLLALDLGELSNITLWNAATDGWVDLLSKPGSYGPGSQSVFSADSRFLAVSGSHGIDVWNVPARKLLYRMGGRDR